MKVSTDEKYAAFLIKDLGSVKDLGIFNLETQKISLFERTTAFDFSHDSKYIIFAAEDTVRVKYTDKGKFHFSTSMKEISMLFTSNLFINRVYLASVAMSKDNSLLLASSPNLVTIISIIPDPPVTEELKHSLSGNIHFHSSHTTFLTVYSSNDVDGDVG